MYLGDQKNVSSKYSQAENPVASYGPFHWKPLPSLQMDQTRDYFANNSSDNISSPTITITSPKEACLSDTNTPESTPLNYTGENLQNAPGMSLHLQGGCSHSVSSRSSPPISRRVLSRNVSDSRIHASTLGDSRRLMSAARRSLRSSDRGQELSETTSDWWSIKTFSELVASSRREHPNWMNGCSSSEFIPSKVSTDLAVSAIERSRLSSPPSASTSPGSETLICGVCSRWLSHKSPLSHHKLSASNDLSVVGVLCCGHVFHAECLEQITPEGEAHDPPCPECHAVEALSTRNRSQEPLVLKSLVNSNRQGQSSARNKLSRIGILTDDMPFEFLSEACSRTIQDLSSQGAEDKVVSQLPSLIERSSLSRSISRTFLFRGKSIKDETLSEPNTKQKGQTPLSNHPREYQSKSTPLKRALKHLQSSKQKVAS